MARQNVFTYTQFWKTKYPNSRLGYLIDALYDTMGDIPFCIDELDESEIIKIIE